MSDEDRFLKGSDLAKLLAGKQRPTRTFQLEAGRFAGQDLCLRALSLEEAEAANADAIKQLTSRAGWTREDFFNDAGTAIYHQELRLQVIARALVSPRDPSVSFAKDADEARKILEPDEVMAIYEIYAEFQEERSPIRRAKTWAEVEGMADALGKGLISPGSLPRYDSTTLRGIITSLVEWARKRTKPSSSDTSPPTDSPDA